MQYSLYKPNSKNTGCAFQFKLGRSNNKKSATSLYLSAIQQHSWNEKTKNGSFSENAKNPDKTLNTKLNENEIGAILYALRVQGEWSSFHTFGENKTSLKLGTYDKKDGGFAFSFGITRNGNQKFGVGIEVGEAETLSEFLKLCLVEMFYENGYNGESTQE